jgi:phosphate transport system protein
MSTITPRETLDRQIRELMDDVLVLGSMVEQATLDAVDALKRRDMEASRRVYAGDVQINEKRFALENDSITLIATQQPMARDLRVLAAILEVITELERMGDYAKGIARINIMMGEQPLVKPLIDVPRMAEITVTMLHDALSAFVEGDADKAREIPPKDDEVDHLYNQVYRELITYMISDPSTIDRANYLMWVAHNLERMADRVTNICERTIYVATGKLMELDASDDETRVYEE